MHFLLYGMKWAGLGAGDYDNTCNSLALTKFCTVIRYCISKNLDNKIMDNK